MSLPFKASKKQENLFHTFIQSAAQLPKQSNIFPFFQFMDQSIRIKFNQLKKSKDKKEKSLTVFEEFWQELDNDDKVSLFVNWTKVLNTAVLIDKNPKLKIDQSISLQDQIFVKKPTIFAKWEKRNATLTAEQLVIARNSKNKNRVYDLKDYEIRKQRSKDNFAWVLQPINKNGKFIQCGVPTQTMFDQWFNALKININNQRVRSFVAGIKQDRENPGSVRRNYSQVQGLELKKQKSLKCYDKTLTERMIDQQLKISQNDGQSEGGEKNDQFQQFSQEPGKKESEKADKHADSESDNDENPNIFKKLIPDYTSILNFTDTPLNSTLLHCDSEYRIYELPSRDGEDINLKVYIVLPYPKSLIFQAIGSQNMAWNDEIDLLTVKTKISSENTVLLYQKNKAQGILYRQRDYLYLRHCFSISNMKQKNTFLVDKSIDSIHHPPFMTVVRAEKQLIWGLVEKQSGKQCILAVEGWIKGGGYMGAQQSKDMTYKYMKKLANLNGFLKQLSFQQGFKSNILFKQDWLVDVSKQDTIDRKKSNISDFSKQEEEILTKSVEKREQELAQFIMRTSQEQGIQVANKSQVLVSDDRLQLENYKPPLFNAQKRVIVPQDYLKNVYVLSPKQKPKKQKIFPHYRGHHLWKGEWQILQNGGLAYIDESKMQEQRKVLTYIIKKIGRNILSGKGILNISLPVDIFCCESNIERLAMSLGFFPHYLEKAAQIKEPEAQLKCIIAAGMGSGLIYFSMEKPFNPILGETYQCWIDDCPIYYEQISHHPPIAAFLMKGRGYTVSGCVEAKMQISINGGTGVNEGVITVAFDNGNTFYYTSAPGCLSGLTYGERKLNLIGKCYYWSNQGLFMEVNYNPALKTKGFFGGVKGQGEQKLSDYFQGFLKQYPAAAVKQLCSKKAANGRQIPAIPKGLPNAEPIKQLYKVYGRWNKYVVCGEQKVFDVDQNRYIAQTQQKYPLPSHSNYREDIVYRRMRDFVVSQEFKEVLEVQQRQDRKQRLRFSKTSSH